MKYGELTGKDLGVLFFGLSEANKLLYQKMNNLEASKLWEDFLKYSPQTISLTVQNLWKIKDEEIDENEMIRLIVKVLVITFSIMDNEVKEKLLPDKELDKITDIDSFLLRLSIYYKDFFEDMTVMVVDRCRTFTRIWLESLNAIDTSYGHDKTVNYQGLEEFLLDIIEAKLKTSSKKKEKHLWELAKDVLPQSMSILKGGYRQKEVGEKDQPDRFASNLLSALTTGVNVNLEKEKGNFDKFFKENYDNLRDFEFFHKELSPGLVWWVKKEMGQSISEDKIIKTESF